MNNLNHVTNLKQLVRITIDDVKLVKGDVKYDFDVTKWHNPNTSNKCAVCLAGSIMAKTLGVDINRELLPSDFDNRTESLLRLIDGLRDVYKVIYLQNFLKTNKIEFDLNNIESLDLNRYGLDCGDVDKWEKLYSDLK